MKNCKTIKHNKIVEMQTSQKLYNCTKCENGTSLRSLYMRFVDIGCYMHFHLSYISLALSIVFALHVPEIQPTARTLRFRIPISLDSPFVQLLVGFHFVKSTPCLEPLDLLIVECMVHGDIE